MKQGLIIVDVQNDFMPGGALGVKEGDQIVPIINGLIDQFPLIVASQDYHPRGHVSFASTHGKKVGGTAKVHGKTQELWPDHCVAESQGAELVKELNAQKIAAIFKKGTDLHTDSYSAFFDNDHQSETGLDVFLREKGVKTLYLVGLATDFCVKYSALDALDLGYEVFIVEDGCRGVFGKQETLDLLRNKGAQIISSSEVRISC